MSVQLPTFVLAAVLAPYSVKVTLPVGTKPVIPVAMALSCGVEPSATVSAL